MRNDILPTRRGLLRAGAAILFPIAARGQRRRRVVVTRNRVVVRPGHPIARAVNRTVITRPARRAVVVTAPLMFLPVVAFTAAVVALPARDRLIWQDTEVIHRHEDWVESNFGIDERGDAILLEVDGRTELDFAEVTFENGEVQVVDFHERTYANGIYQLLDFRGRRRVKTARVVARAKTAEARLRIYLSA